MSRFSSRKETARALGICLTTLDKLRASGILQESLKAGKVIRFDIDACKKALADHAASQRPQWAEEPTFSQAHLVAPGSRVAVCGAKGSMAGWSQALPDQPRCRRCQNIEKKP